MSNSGGKTLPKRDYHLLAAGFVLLVAIVAGCESPTVEEVRPSFAMALIEDVCRYPITYLSGTYSDPCRVDGEWQTRIGNQWVPCSVQVGGCFPNDPQAPPVVWGNQEAGGVPNPAAHGNTQPTSVAPTTFQKMDISIAIRQINRCLGLKSSLNSRYASGIRLLDYNDTQTYGHWSPEDNTIYIANDNNKHWDAQGNLADPLELYRTLLHEAIHVWMIGARTSHGNPDTEDHFQRVWSQCREW